MAPAPVQARLPVIVAADGPKALAVVAEHADAWATFPGAATAEDFHRTAVERGRILDRLCEERGRDPGAAAPNPARLRCDQPVGVGRRVRQARRQLPGDRLRRDRLLRAQARRAGCVRPGRRATAKTEPMSRWQQIARDTAGADYAEQYAARFRALAARGDDVHGEATFVRGLVDPPAHGARRGLRDRPGRDPAGRARVRRGRRRPRREHAAAGSRARRRTWTGGWPTSRSSTPGSSSTSCWSPATRSRCSSPAPSPSAAEHLAAAARRERPARLRLRPRRRPPARRLPGDAAR